MRDLGVNGRVERREETMERRARRRRRKEAEDDCGKVDSGVKGG